MTVKMLINAELLQKRDSRKKSLPWTFLLGHADGLLK